MTRRMKSFISLLLCICMFVGTLPDSMIQAFAEETGTQQEEGESVMAEVSGVGESATEEDTEYLDQSVTVDISAAQVDGKGDALTTALTGETLTAVVSAYNDNPNYEAEATIRIYVEKISGDSDSEVQIEKIPDIEVSGAGSSDKASAVTVEAKWHEADGTNILVPYLEFSIPSGASAVFNLELSYPTGYDKSASAKIYAEVVTVGEDQTATSTITYNSDDSSDYLTFTWTGDAEWDKFTKTASLDAIGVANGEIKADEVDWTFSAKNNTSGSTGVIYTNYVTMTDTLTLPEGLSVTGGEWVLASSSPASIRTASPSSDKIVVGEIQNSDKDVVYAIFLDKTYEGCYSLSDLSVNTDSTSNQTQITYTITITNSDVTNVSFNPVSAISTAIYLSELMLDSSASLTDAKMVNTAKLTVYSVVEDNSNSSGYEELLSLTADSKVKFDTEMTLGVEKTVYQVTDGIGNVTYGEGLDTSVGTTLSNEKKDSDGTPYVAQGYTVTYQVTVSSTFAKATDATMTDTLPSELTLDESSIVVTSGDSVLTLDNDYKLVVSTDQTSGETKLTVEVNSVPANGSVVIQYGCTVNNTATTANKEIKNVAAVGDRTASATVKTPENGDVKITREIIQRTTTTSNGYTLKIYKNLKTGNYEFSVDNAELAEKTLLAYFGMAGNISQEEFEEAILKVNAGDTIEYLITVENNSLENVYGEVYESNLFSSAADIDESKQAFASEKIGANAGGWNYYIAGSSTYLHTEVDSSNYKVSVKSEEGVADAQEAILAQCKYSYQDLEKYSKDSGINTTYGNALWKFYVNSGSALQAYTTYHQTTVVEIPGDNTISSASEKNAGFQNLVSSYAYYCTDCYNEYLSEWADYAYFVPTDSGADASEGVSITARDIYGFYVHTPERQIYLNTGTLASTVLDDKDVSKLSTEDEGDGLITELLYESTSSEVAANDYANSGKFFTADENCYVVNYAYLFNDSSEEMNLEDYSLSVVLPDGFEWVGFTCPITESGNVTTSTSYRKYSAVSSSVSVNEYYGSNYDLWVNNTRAQGLTIGELAYSAGTTADYYADKSGASFPSTMSQMEQALSATTNISQNIDDPSDVLSCTTNAKEGDKGTITLSFTSTITSVKPTIAAYNGIVVMYVAKVSDASEVKEKYSGTESTASNAAATFQVYIERKNNTKYTHSVDSENYCMSQISPVIRAQDAASSSRIGSTVYRGLVSNDGNANTVLNCSLDEFYSASSSTVAGGSASRMWSYVSLSMYAETTSVSVTKEVVKNNGADPEDNYSNGLTSSIGEKLINYLDTTTKLTGGFDTSYDDYVYKYPLLDGLHRTVDGTVTWKVKIENTGDVTDTNTSSSVSEGAVYNYSSVDCSTFVETIDSPYHLIEVAVPALYYTYSATGTPRYTYTYLYFELPDADPSDSDAMIDAGWVADSEEEGCYYYEVCARNSNGTSYASGKELTGLSNIAYFSSNALCMRVTVRCLESGSVAYGYDYTSGNKNTDAYQYLIEFTNYFTGARSYKFYPYLYTATEISSITALKTYIELYLTFSTDDSIETNYNSFGLVLNGVDADDVMIGDGNEDGKVDATDGEITTVSEMHNGKSSSSGTSSMTASSYTGSAYSAGSVASDTTVVQANDWTDTSYTYGEKTISVLDENGNVVEDENGSEMTINSREDGDMTLPSAVTAGTTIHNTLKWESVLYESENYSGVTDLVLYDTYGVQADCSSTGEIMSGYNVDFSSITVQLCLTDDIAANETSGSASTDGDAFKSTELALGTDYEIYYTTAPLVTTEHHPIAVNTLTYAADLENFDNATWIKYNPDDPDCDGSDALAFKIVLSGTGAAGIIYNGRYTGQSNWVECEIYVDYDATVSDSVIAGECYPNVLAWTAEVIYPKKDDNGNVIDTIYKPIQQDTTAMFFEAAESNYPTLSKTVVNESGDDISSQVTSEEFTYLVFRTNKTSASTTNLKSESNITGVAAVTIHAGETITLYDSNLDILYNVYASGDDSAETFWNVGNSSYYYIVEMDSGDYTEESISLADTTNVKGSAVSGVSIGSMGTIAEKITSEAAAIQENADAATDATKKAALETQAALYKAVASYLDAGATSKVAYFAVSDSSSDWSVSIASVNKYTSPTLVIYKWDATSDAIIMNEVTFQIQDAEGNTLCFTETSGGYAYAGIFDSANTTGVTADLAFNGTTSVTGLPEGTYALVETSAPENYVLSEVPTEFIIAAERDTHGELVTSIEVKVENKADTNMVSGSVKLVKVDADTRTAITTGSASFQLYNSDAEGSKPLGFVQDEESGTAVDGSYTYTDGSGETTISTDASTGILELRGLPVGTYYLVETSAPDGYEASYTALDTAYKFTISQTQSEIAIDFPNEFIDADIVIAKTDAGGKAITGNPASFALTDGHGNTVSFSYSSDGIYTYDEDGSVTELATSSTDGRLTLKNLPKGTYTLTETCAPKGYTVSTKPVTIDVTSTDQQNITVENKTASMRLRIVKTWQLEGRKATYAFSGVDFTLYEVDADTNTAKKVTSGTTNGSGILDFDDLDWSKVYYLYEDVPDGYSASGILVTVYLDADGVIDLSITENTENKDGYTAIKCIRINMAENLCSANSSGEEYCTDIDGTWTYTQDVLNVKTETYGGMYASTSYKTISNAKSAAAHEGLEEQTGYSYFYQQSDYNAGNYNYVNAIRDGDTVTYTLNVSNVSDYEFTGLVLIDRMPETGDTGVVNSSAARDSQFTVEVANPANIVVTVDGVEVSADLYEVTYSSKVKFTNSDFNGTSSWSTTAGDSTKSFRIVFSSSFTLNPGQTLVVTYDGVIDEDADIGEIAWNNFAYRYTVSSGSKTITLTPEPPKVGVMIQGESYKVTKEWEDDSDSLGLRPSSVTLQLKKKDSSGNLTEVDNGIVTLTYKEDASGSESTESLTATIEKAASGSTVKVEASLDEDGNWICLWTGLPILDDGSSYVVEEIDTGSTNYVWSVAMEENENGVESEESAIVTNTLTFTTLNLVKQDSDGGALSGTQFSLERQTGTNTWETVNGIYTIDSKGNITTTSLTSDMLTTGNDGKITITGLQAGTYRITEVKSKSGYTLLSDPLVIELPVSYTKDEVKSKNIDTSGSDVYLTGDTWYFYNITYTITNTANFTMPSAGQTAGSVWVSGLFGALLLAGAWMFLLHRRRANHLINHLPDTP